MNQLFEVSTGISVDNAVQYLYGNTHPSLDALAVAAPVGSSFSNIADGAQFKKVANLGAATDWQELAGNEVGLIVTGVASTGIVLDQVACRLADSFAWEVTAISEADASNKVSMLVHMSHNGTATVDATSVKHGTSNRIQHGPALLGLSVSATLSGVGADQMMNLHVSSTNPTTFVGLRMIKNLAGNSTLVVGGANLGNHLLDGSVHLTFSQNAFLDALSPSLSATMVNQLVGVSGNVQTQLDSKATAATVDAAVAAEVAARESADLALATDIATQATALTAEAQTRATADQTLTTAVSTAQTAATAAQTAAATAQTAADAAQATANTALANSNKYDVAGWVAGKSAANDTVLRAITARAFSVTANFALSKASAGVAATAAATYSVKKNGVQFGTFAFAAGGTVATFSTSAATSFVAGDVLSISAPATADATLADVSFAIAGTSA